MWFQLPLSSGLRVNITSVFAPKKYFNITYSHSTKITIALVQIKLMEVPSSSKAAAAERTESVQLNGEVGLFVSKPNSSLDDETFMILEWPFESRRIRNMVFHFINMWYTFLYEAQERLKKTKDQENRDRGERIDEKWAIISLMHHVSVIWFAFLRYLLLIFGFAIVLNGIAHTDG